MIRSASILAIALGFLVVPIVANADVTITIPIPDNIEHYDPAVSAAQNSIDPDLADPAKAAPVLDRAALPADIAARCQLVIDHPADYSKDVVAFCQGM